MSGQKGTSPVRNTSPAGHAGSAASAGQAGQPSRPGQPQRRSSGSLPGLSSMASSLRSRQSSSLARSSFGRSGRGAIEEEDDDDDDEEDVAVDGQATNARPGQTATQRHVDPSQLEEIRKGIFMPGLGGNRANTETRSQQSSSSMSSPPLASQRAAGSGDSTQQGSQMGSLNPTSGQNRAVAQNYGDKPFRSRAQPTLKASMLKKRAPAGTSTASNSTASAKKPSSVIPRIGQGTPARATRYSLPVRAEKPVRTSKMTGKHIVLPSESQLAPLPDEDDDDDDDDDDEDEDDESSEDETDAEIASHADEDEQVPEDADEEARERARQATKRRREEAQARLEEARKEKARKRQERKPKGAPGHPDTREASAAKAQGAKLAAFRGPAHARAPPRVPKSTGPVYHTFERLAPSARVYTPLPRLTSYAVAPAIHIPTLNGFLRREHSVKPRLYDECAYVVYFRPLLPGFGRALVRSSPEPRTGSPGAESRREREIVEREESGYVGSYFVNNNKDDEDNIDEQGYIHGGEGQGQEDEDDVLGRSRHHRQETGRGDVTETENEMEREGPTLHRRDVEASETETEAEGETDSKRHRDRYGYNSGQVAASEDEEQALQSSVEQHEEIGTRTPRAVTPTIDSGDVQPEDLTVLGEPAFPSASKDLQVSNEDVAGAQDLLSQQHRIEQGNDDQIPMPEQRSVDSYDGGETRWRTKSSSGAGNGGGSHRAAQRQRDREERRRTRREQRRAARMQAPNAASHNHDTTPNMLTSRSVFEALQVAELIILPYGVLVMYNFTESEERDIISDVISSGCVRGGPPLTQDDEETEAFHFCYDPSVPAPRIFNDFFTFRGPNHLLKLSLAHAIAQSTKLSVFEESMQRTLELTSHIPKELAISGELRLKRREALKLTGRLFKLRVDVNLTSNVLDTPELFWSEASLKALYDAIREYLEVDQRVENLNERLAVGNDLLEVIHDHLGSQSMNQITWIIIILIVVACIVACGEITARLVLHARTRKEAMSAVYSALATSSLPLNSAPALADGSTGSPTSMGDLESMRQIYSLLIAAAKAASSTPQSQDIVAEAADEASRFLIQ